MSDLTHSFDREPLTEDVCRWLAEPSVRAIIEALTVDTDAIMEAVAAAHGMTVAEMTLPSKKRPLVYVRQEAAYQIRAATGWIWADVARAMGLGTP